MGRRSFGLAAQQHPSSCPRPPRQHVSLACTKKQQCLANVTTLPSPRIGVLLPGMSRPLVRWGGRPGVALSFSLEGCSTLRCTVCLVNFSSCPYTSPSSSTGKVKRVPHGNLILDSHCRGMGTHYVISVLPMNSCFF